MGPNLNETVGSKPGDRMTAEEAAAKLAKMGKPTVSITEKAPAPDLASISLPKPPPIPSRTNPAAEAIAAVLGEDLKPFTQALVQNDMILAAAGVGGSTKGAAANISNSNPEKAAEYTVAAQKLLVAAGYLKAGSYEAGKYDEKTVEAVKKLQGDPALKADGISLKVDGVIGKDTSLALTNAALKKLNPELSAEELLASEGIATPPRRAAESRSVAAPSTADSWEDKYLKSQENLYAAGAVNHRVLKAWGTMLRNSELYSSGDESLRQSAVVVTNIKSQILDALQVDPTAQVVLQRNSSGYTIERADGTYSVFGKAGEKYFELIQSPNAEPKIHTFSNEAEQKARIGFLTGPANPDQRNASDTIRPLNSRSGGGGGGS